MSKRFDTKGFFFFCKLLFGFVFLGALVYGCTELYTRFAFAEDISLSSLDVRISNIRDNRFLAYLLGQSDQLEANIEIAIPETGKALVLDLTTSTLTLYEESLVFARLPIEEVSDREILEQSSELYIRQKETLLEQTSITASSTALSYALEISSACSIHGPVVALASSSAPDQRAKCIRLSAKDAETTYSFASLGSPVLIMSASPEINATQLPQESIPTTGARSYLVGDIETGEVYAEKRSARRYPIASITKLMTVLVANELRDPSQRPIHMPSQGKHYILSDLYYPLLLASDNEVADVIAQNFGRAEFLKAMNAKAKELGMYTTSFQDPSGLSPYNKSTTIDLFHLAQYIAKERQFLLRLSRRPQATIASIEPGEWTVKNQNKFATDERFVGGKLGFTDEALQTSLGIFNVEIEGKKRQVAIIILGSRDWKQDTKTLLSWLEKQK